MLRKGQIGMQRIEEVLEGAGVRGWRVAEGVQVRAEGQPQEAPGQLIRHYAPRVTTYLYIGGELEKAGTVMIDFGG